MRRMVLATVLLGLLVPATTTATGAERARFDTRVFALVPTPGFPASAYATPDGRVFEGTYDNPMGDRVPSRVLEWTAGGTLVRSFTIRGQDLSGPHGVQVATSDGAGRLVLLDKNPPRVIKLDPATDAQTGWASFPAGTVPNHAVWGPDRALYVTDYGGPRIWRVPPGGGRPTVWLEDPRFDGAEFGLTGIGLTPDAKELLVAVMSGAGGAAGNPAAGRLYAVPLGADGKPGPPRQLWESRPFDGPDAFGVARSGRIYIALLLANQLAVIEPDGRESARFPADGAGGANGSPVPFDAPSNVRFSGSRMLVANQSFLFGDRTRQAVLDVWAGEPGLAELIPPDRVVEGRRKAAAQRARAKAARARALKRARKAERR